jgi:hypothetical protein
MGATHRKKEQVIIVMMPEPVMMGCTHPTVFYDAFNRQGIIFKETLQNAELL